MLDLGRLHALHAVAAYGSITAAASALGYTPSAVSQQIAKLERETRCDLLDRQGRRAVLTPAGQLLAHATRDVLHALERAEARLEEQRGTPAGRLLLAAFPTACRGLMPGVLAELSRYPELDARLLESDPYRAIELVAEREVDIAVVHDWDNIPLVLPEAVVSAKVGDDTADVLLPADHPLAARDLLDLSDLAGQRWVGQSPGSMCHDWLTRTFAECGVQPEIAYQVDEFQSQMAVVAAGLGVALLPRLGRGPVPPGTRLVGLRPAPTRRVLVVWRLESERRPAVSAALAAVHDHWSHRADHPHAAAQ